MVTGMQGALLIIVAILATSLLAARELVRATTQARHKARALDLASEVLDQCLHTTENLLADDRVPPTLKRVLSGQILALANPDVVGPRIREFLDESRREDFSSAPERDVIIRAMDELACENPHLLAECRTAISLAFFVLVAMHAENWKAEFSAQETVTSPYGMPFGIDRLFGGGGLNPA